MTACIRWFLFSPSKLQAFSLFGMPNSEFEGYEESITSLVVRACSDDVEAAVGASTIESKSKFFVSIAMVICICKPNISGITCLHLPLICLLCRLFVPGVFVAAVASYHGRMSWPRLMATRKAVLFQFWNTSSDFMTLGTAKYRRPHHLESSFFQ